MAHLYREPRFCECGYVTNNRGNWSTHRRCCKHRPANCDAEKDQHRERVASLEAQLANKDERIVSLEAQLASKDERIASREAQLANKDERVASLEAQLAAKDAQLAAKDAQLVGKDDQLLEVREELRKTKKRKDRHAEKAANRLKLTEPRRREILRRQNFMCADPDGKCTLCGELEAFDIDHITPLWKDGEDSLDNMQALCPACHRRKTDRERLERSEGISTAGPEV